MKLKGSYKKILIILGILAIVFFVAYYFVYRDIKARNEHISSLSQELNFQSSRQEYLLSTQRMIENISTDIDRINNSIVSSDGNVKFIEELESIAKNQGLSITIDSLIIEDDPALTSSGITTLKIKAKTLGSWAGTYTFLAQIESLPLKIKINQFILQETSDNSNPDKKVLNLNWRSSFEMRVLKYK